MHPVLFTLFGVEVHGYGVAGAVGFLVVSVIAIARGAALGYNRERIADVIFWTAIVALIGSRVLYVVLNASQFDGWRSWVNLRTGGLVFYGALLTGLPAALLLMRRFGMAWRPMMDVFATALPLGHGLSRLGCLMAGCCYGRPTDLPWGVVYTDPYAPGPHGVALHPTQAYEAAWLLLTGLVCNLRYANKRFDGEILLIWLGSYAVFRPINELFRDDPTRGWFLESVLGPTVSTSQAISAGFLAVVIGLAAAWLRPRPSVGETP